MKVSHRQRRSRARLVYSLASVLSLFILALPSSAALKGRIRIGLGGGYSPLLLNAGLSSSEFFQRRLIKFEEGIRMSFSLNAYGQYSLSRNLGLQLEFAHQNARYYSHLEWYAYIIQDMVVEVNHLEKPYWEGWSLYSLALSLVFALNSETRANLYPYAQVGAGIYFLRGDEDLVLNRFQLGPQRSGLIVKAGGGLKYRLGKKTALNFRLTAETIWRKYRQSSFLYVGYEQFDYPAFIFQKKIIRNPRVFLNTFSYLGLSLIFEFSL